jgi:hypothetical protein
LGEIPSLISLEDKMNKEQQRKYRKASVDRAKQCIKELKINGCAICGYDKCNRALNFHHVNPESKSFQVGINEIRKKKSKELVEELNKCMLLCSNCHMEIEEKQRK